jgi:hypothetical protein
MNNLIDRYVAEVGRYLPEKSRADIEAEIRSTLEDMLEDRSQEVDRPVDDAMVVEVLEEFGSPAKVAASYMPERYLIGPRMYPIFMTILKIVLAVVFVIGLFQIGFTLSQGSAVPGGLLGALGETVGGVVLSLITAFGNLALTFAIIERVVPNLDEKTEKAEKWDPRLLPEISPKTERVDVPGIIGETVFIVAGILLFNFYPRIIQGGALIDGQWVSFPVLSNAFFTYLPWFNILWALQLVMNAVLLRQGNWQPATRVFSIIVNVFEVVLTYAMLVGPSIVAISASDLRAIGIGDPAAAQGLANLISAGVTMGLIVAIVVASIQAIISAYRLLIGNKKPPISLPTFTEIS